MARSAAAVAHPRRTNGKAPVRRSARKRLVLVKAQDKGARERAYRRVCDLAWKVGEARKWERGWVARAAETLGLEAALMSSILRGSYGERLGLVVIERVAKKLKCTIGSFCDA